MGLPQNTKLLPSPPEKQNKIKMYSLLDNPQKGTCKKQTHANSASGVQKKTRSTLALRPPKDLTAAMSLLGNGSDSEQPWQASARKKQGCNASRTWKVRKGASMSCGCQSASSSGHSVCGLCGAVLLLRPRVPFLSFWVGLGGRQRELKTLVYIVHIICIDIVVISPSITFK